jgi:hypothetical protein
VAAALQRITFSQFMMHLMYDEASSLGSNASVFYLGDVWFQSGPGTGYPEVSRDFSDSIPVTAKMVSGNRARTRHSTLLYIQHSLIILPFDATYSELLTEPLKEQTR